MLTFPRQYVPFLFVVLVCGLVSACGMAQGTLERHKISTTVIYADAETIYTAARGRGYRGPLVVRGFYDPIRNEIWCPNEETPQALRTCGHELRHFIKGQFHY